MTCNRIQTFQKVLLLSCHSTGCFTKHLWDHQDVFLANVRQGWPLFQVLSFKLALLEPWTFRLGSETLSRLTDVSDFLVSLELSYLKNVVKHDLTITFFTQCLVGLDVFYPSINDIIILKLHFVLHLLSLSHIKIDLMIWNTWVEYDKIFKKTFSHHCTYFYPLFSVFPSFFSVLLVLCSSLLGQKDESVNQTSASPPPTPSFFIPWLYHLSCTASCHMALMPSLCSLCSSPSVLLSHFSLSF